MARHLCRRAVRRQHPRATMLINWRIESGTGYASGRLQFVRLRGTHLRTHTDTDSVRSSGSGTPADACAWTLRWRTRSCRRSIVISQTPVTRVILKARWLASLCVGLGWCSIAHKLMCVCVCPYLYSRQQRCAPCSSSRNSSYKLIRLHFSRTTEKPLYSAAAAVSIWVRVGQEKVED